MESIDSLKNRFISIRRTADGKFARGDFAGAMTSYEASADLLDQIYRRESNARDKKELIEISKELQARYDECKRNLGVKINEPPRKAPVSPSPKPVAPAPSEPSKAPNEEGAPQDIQYEFEIGGKTINVRTFLSESSNLTDVYFDDVVGMEYAKKIARREFFASKERQEFRKAIKAKNKNFILLYGLPGTGKTYFAIALSNELRQYYGENVPFINVIGGTLKSAYPGETEKNIKAIFEYAKQFERCVLFLDEFDAIGMSRQKPTGDPTLRDAVTTLIQLLGGFCNNPNLLVLAATNTPYDLDGAILSRASLKFEVPLPSHVVLKGVLAKNLADWIDDDVDLDDIALQLEKKKYSNRDCSSLIELLKDALDEAHEEDASIEKISAAMFDDAISSFQPTVVASEERKLREFTQANA